MIILNIFIFLIQCFSISFILFINRNDKNFLFFYEPLHRLVRYVERRERHNPPTTHSGIDRKFRLLQSCLVFIITSGCFLSFPSDHCHYYVNVEIRLMITYLFICSKKEKLRKVIKVSLKIISKKKTNKILLLICSIKKSF